MDSSATAPRRYLRRARPAGFAGVVVLTGVAVIAATLLLPLTAGATTQDNPSNIFRSFPVDAGLVQTATGPSCTSPFNGANGADVCNTNNPFLQANFGTDHGNGQSCETCHQPQLGWSVTPDFLAGRFSDTNGTGDQFRVNDTVTDPRICGAPTAATSQAQNAANVNACVASLSLAQKQAAYNLFVTLSIHRIALKDNPALDDFSISATTSSVDGSESFGPAGTSGPIIPAGEDSQNPCVVQTGTPSLTGCLPTVGVFRRPLVTTNTSFDSSALWDGRQNVCCTTTPATG